MEDERLIKEKERLFNEQERFSAEIKKSEERFGKEVERYLSDKECLLKKIENLQRFKETVQEQMRQSIEVIQSPDTSLSSGHENIEAIPVQANSEETEAQQNSQSEQIESERVSVDYKEVQIAAPKKEERGKLEKSSTNWVKIGHDGKGFTVDVHVNNKNRFTFINIECKQVNDGIIFVNETSAINKITDIIASISELDFVLLTRSARNVFCDGNGVTWRKQKLKTAVRKKGLCRILRLDEEQNDVSPLPFTRKKRQYDEI